MDEPQPTCNTVCRYMHELQQKDKKVVLSVKALETIYHTASSSIGKLISGKQYLGGAALEQLRDKVEAEGRSCRLRRKRGCCKDRQDWRRRVVLLPKIKRKPVQMTSFENIRKIRRKCSRNGT